jgi:hypothetical protein
MGDEGFPPWAERVEDAIEYAEGLLPGVAAPEGENDPRWQAIIEVERFIKTDPEPIWRFISNWGSHENEDLRVAIGVCLLEHLLELHFDEYFPKVEEMTRADRHFADTLSRCSKMGKAQDPRNAARFDRLLKEFGPSAG